LLDALELVHGIRELHARCGKGRGVRWLWSRMTGWRAVHAVMQAAGIPRNLVQKWLGHAQLTTTTIYTDATGAEEKDIARRM
jgi:integrase/recombinase XerD